MTASCAVLSSMLKKCRRRADAAKTKERPDSWGGLIRFLSPLGHFTAELAQRRFSPRSNRVLFALRLKHAFARWLTIPIPIMPDRRHRFDGRKAR